MIKLDLPDEIVYSVFYKHRWLNGRMLKMVNEKIDNVVVNHLIKNNRDGVERVMNDMVRTILYDSFVLRGTI